MQTVICTDAYLRIFTSYCACILHALAENW